MILIATTIEAMRQAIADARRRGLTVGLVPTMGALHAGHTSLIQRARAENGFVAVSIFVNPTQFGPHEDLTRYPRPFERDRQICEKEKVDLIFHPEPGTIYPEDFRTFVEVDELQNVLEGTARPGHFRGVATVVLKLFNIVGPDVAYFGQKDAQQARLLGQMVKDLNVPVTMKVCPTVREPDGLALSSRNAYLDPEQRRQALVLFRALEAIRARIEAGERQARPLIDLAIQMIKATPAARLDHVAVVDYQTLRPVERLRATVLIPVAVYFGATRLIDNLLISVPT